MRINLLELHALIFTSGAVINSQILLIKLRALGQKANTIEKAPPNELHKY